MQHSWEVPEKDVDKSIVEKFVRTDEDYRRKVKKKKIVNYFQLNQNLKK